MRHPGVPPVLASGVLAGHGWFATPFVRGRSLKQVRSALVRSAREVRPRKGRRDEPPPLMRFNAEVPERLERVVLRCLAKRPYQRYPSAADLAGELESCLTVH